MTGQEIIDRFHNYVPDQLDPDFELELANEAMRAVEDEVMPEAHKKVDSSQSASAGQTYATGVSLPADFYLPEARIYVGGDPLLRVPFERAREYRDSNGYWYVDHGSGTYHLCGTQPRSAQITFPYRRETPEITLVTSPLWPARFHSLIPMRMAMDYYSIDAGERGRAWDDRWAARYERALHGFKGYSARLKLAGMDGSVAPVDSARHGEDSITDLP